MKKLLIALLMLGFFGIANAADWDSTTDMQALTVSAAVAQVQDCLQALDGTAGVPPASVVTGNTAFTSSITPTTLSANRIVTLPNANSVTLPSGAAFFMLSGSCPAGTTDITATYSGDFIKINATQGTQAGPVLTGTSDSHVLSIAEIPAHHHDSTRDGSWTAVGSNFLGGNVNSGSISTDDTGGGGGHTHTLSAATTCEPLSVTMKLCEVD